jgi:hypothetical protein
MFMRNEERGTFLEEIFWIPQKNDGSSKFEEFGRFLKVFEERGTI